MDRQRLSPGWQTHLLFADFDGVVQDRGDRIVVRSPLNTGFYWGNFLLFDRAPTDADFSTWMRHFELDIVVAQPGTRHVAFGIAAAPPDFQLPQAFAEAAFVAGSQAVLLLQRVQLLAAPAPRVACELRVLDLHHEAAAVVALEAACNDLGFDADGYVRFRQAQMRRYAAMQDAGLGHWHGAWVDGVLVAGLGLFGRHGIGRFQHVVTHPLWRRRGLCRALVHAACQHGFGILKTPTLVMCADPDDVAIGIYESVGFERQGLEWTLERRAPEDMIVAQNPAP